MCDTLTRRGFLKHGGVAALTLPLLSTPAFARRKYQTKHVILVAFAGGVRSRETILTPNNVPNLMRIAENGVICPNVNVMNNGHFGATMSIFTGITEYLGIRENERGENPTVFEYVRKHAAVPASMVWLSTSGGAQQRNLVYGTHPEYGEAYGANLIDGDGIFNAEFRKVLDAFGRPGVPSAQEDESVARLRGAMTPPPAGDGRTPNDPATVDRLQKYILEEIQGRTSNITGPGAGDARAIAVAVSVLRLFKPTLMGVVLTNADIAHGSFNAYVEVIRRADEQLGRLWDSIQADPELRDSTTIMILPEFGRDRNLNQRNGLDHGDNSPELRKVAMVASGPDLRKGRTVSAEIKSIDACPTACELLGVDAGLAKGSVIREILGR
ncbi:MAG: twin-arginine translocation signal domain-containing protein [Planctomycetaceae bacterium]